MTTEGGVGDVRKEHKRAEEFDRAKQNEELLIGADVTDRLQQEESLLTEIISILWKFRFSTQEEWEINPLEAEAKAVQASMKIKAEQILAKAKPIIEKQVEARYDNDYMEIVRTEAREQERERILGKDRPRIVCLCGSTRFTNEMLIKQWWFTKYGYIVLSWCALPDNYFQGKDKAHIGDQEGVKEIVDEVHKRKIDLCDEVFVLNINGYIGESTRSEIEYAKKISKPIKYWQALKGEK